MSVDGLGQAECAVGGEGHVFREAPRALEPELFGLVALRGRAGAAELTLPAADQGEAGDSITGLPLVVDAGAQLDDLGRELVAEHESGEVERIGQVEVGTADSARGDAHEELSRARGRFRSLLDYQRLLDSLGDHGAHAADRTAGRRVVSCSTSSPPLTSALAASGSGPPVSAGEPSDTPEEDVSW